MRREHLFITTRHFENCHRFQIFGVGKASINQLGLVNRGDKVFFLSKDDNLIIGPYEVTSDVFYNEEIIWQERKGVDAYPYRILLESKSIYAININAFSQIVEENGIRIDSGDLGQKSVFTFMPKDTGILDPALKEKGTTIKKAIKYIDFQKDAVTIKLAKSQGFTEAFLEFFLLKDTDKLFSGSDFIVYNQLRINLLGSKIDIIAISEKVVLVIELKRGAAKKEDMEQLQDYARWAKDNRNLLERFFKISLDEAEIRNILIGSGTQKGIRASNSFKKYSLENDELNLS